jgi:hypothetical protein
MRRSASTGPTQMRGTGDDEISYATGWTISGLATPGTIVAIWLLGIWLLGIWLLGIWL